MRLEWLDDILAVHDTGSLRAAAEIRFLTASAFTRRIKVVEESIGGDLLDRNNKPATLRPHVLELIPRMREAAAQLRTLQDELSVLNEDVQISKLICQHTLSVSWAPKVTKTLSQSDARVRIRSGSKDTCLLAVLKGEADIALVYDDPMMNLDQGTDLFERMRFGTEEFMPVAALRDHEDLARKINKHELPIVAYPRNLFLGEALEKAIAKTYESGVMFSTVAETGLGPAALEFVREGIGIGWLPHSMIETELASGEFTAMTHIVPSFQLIVVALKSRSSRSKRVLKNWHALQERFEQLEG